VTRRDREKVEARSKVVQQLQRLTMPRPKNRATNEGVAEAFLFSAATVISATDNLGVEVEVLGGLVDRLWEAAEEWVKERKQQLGRAAEGGDGGT
jgi:hypothetical protein